MYVLCLGADSTLADPLAEAQRQLATQFKPEGKQRYEKVHKDTHTIAHFGITNDCWQRSCLFSVFAC